MFGFLVSVVKGRRPLMEPISTATARIRGKALRWQARAPCGRTTGGRGLFERRLRLILTPLAMVCRTSVFLALGQVMITKP